MAGLSEKDVTVICPENDLESKTIVELAISFGIPQEHIRISAQQWGARLENEPKQSFAALKKNVVIIEIPGPAIEKKLEEKGHQVHVIDHHIYSDLDRSHRLSSIEQFAILFGKQLDRKSQLVAANDRGHVREMCKVPGISYEELEDVRDQENGVLGVNIEQSIYDFNQNRLIIDEYTSVVFTKQDRLSKIADLGQFPTKSEFEKFLSNPEEYPLPTKNILIVKIEDQTEIDRSRINESDQLVYSSKIPRPIEINFFGERQYLDDFEEFLSKNKEQYQYWLSGDRSLKTGYLGAKHVAHIGQEKSVSNPSIEKLTCHCLQTILGYDLPYKRFATMLLLPFKPTVKNIDTNKSDFWKEKCIFENVTNIDLASETPNTETQRSKKVKVFEETEYFHSHVNEFLFKKVNEYDTVTKAIRYYEPKSPVTTDNPGKFTISYNNHLRNLPAFFDIPSSKQTTFSTSFDLTHMAIHRFYNNISILVLELSHKPDEKKNIYEEIYTYVATKEINNSLFYLPNASSKVLHFNMLSRQLNWEFEEQQDTETAKIPVSVEIDTYDKTDICNPYTHRFQKRDIDRQFHETQKGNEIIVSEAIGTLIDRFVGEKNKYELVLDNRMFVYSFIALQSEKPLTSLQKYNHNVWFSKFMYVDFVGKNYEYDSSFTDRLMEKNVYERWKHYGVLYGFSRYSSVFNMYGYWNKLFEDYESMYYQIVMIAYFYRATLISFSKELATVTAHLNRKISSKDAFYGIKKRFAQFTNIYWFSELTNQIQGVEIFDHYKHAFGLPDLYQKVKEEIERAAELEAINKSQKNEFKNRLIGIGALVVAVLAIILGFFSMNFKTSLYTDKYLKNELWYSIVEFGVAISTGLALALLAIGFIWLIILVIKKFISYGKG